MAKRPEKKKLFTPIGPFKYAHLNKPDTRYKDEGEYSVVVALDKDTKETKAFIKNMQTLVDEQKEAAEEGWDNATPKQKAAWKKKGIKAPVIVPFYDEELDDEGDPTGRILVRFKTRASFTDKDGKTTKKVVPLVDGLGQIIPAKKRPLVYAGTEGRVAFGYGTVFIAKDAETYLTFYLNQVQITKLVSGGGATSAFGAVDDSDFSADELEEWEGNADDGDLDDYASEEADDIDDEIPF
jgi:hypothetical protein